MLLINRFIIFALIITLCYFIGILIFISDYEENKCEMTYMFEYPQFVRISMKTDKIFPKYALYAYSEGHFTERARNMFFNGIPVLFIPGNAGSYKQVRSLASIALRKSLNSRPGFHFDYFTVDLNDELSGLNGALLNEQMRYVNDSIQRILELYQKNKMVESVILVGHSMGGVIARALVFNLPKDSNLIPIVVTLSAPHLRPPLIFDFYADLFYKKISNDLPNNTTFVSVSGGYDDFLIPSHITNFKSNNSLHVVSTNVPRSWIPADHLCILWCKQLILAINRALFDCVDLKTKQLSSDFDYRQSVFQHHLISHSGVKVQFKNHYTSQINLDNQGEWIENLNRQYSVRHLKGTKQTEWHMIRYVDQPKHEILTVIGLNMGVTNWIFACPAIHVRKYSRICNDGMHLSHLSEIIPSANYKRRMLKINLHELKKNYTSMTHVVFKIPPTQDPIVFHVDVYPSSDRKITIALPNTFSFITNTIIKETIENAISYELIMPQLQKILQSYLLYVKPIQCVNKFHHATASLIVPWGNENNHVYITDTDRKPLHVRLYSPKPQQNSQQNASVHLTLDPTCRYHISIKSSFTGTLGQFARFYSPILLPNMATVIVMTLWRQMYVLGKEGRCCFFFFAMNDGAKPYYILGIVKMIGRMLSSKPLLNFLPVPDWVILMEEGLDFFLLPLILYLCGVGIVWLLAMIVTGSLVVCESTINKFALKFLARSLRGTINLSDHLMSILQKLPCIVAGLLIFLSVTSCGALSLCLGAGFYFMKLAQMSQDCVESIVWKVIKIISKKCKSWFTKKQKVEKTNEIVSETSENLDNSKSTTQDDSKITKESELTTDVVGEEQQTKDETNEQENIATPQNLQEPNIIIQFLEHNKIFFHFTIFLIWTMIALLNLPYILTWAHNFKYNTALQPDPSFIPGIVLSVCAVPLWQLDLPNIDKLGYSEMSYLMFISAGLILIYGTISVYRLTYILTAIIAFVTLHQLFAPKKSIVDNSSDESDDKHEKLLDRVKTKWE